MSLLRYSVLKRNVFSYNYGKAFSYECKKGKTRTISFLQIDLSADPQCLASRVLPGSILRSNVTDPRRFLCTSRPQRCDTKTIRVVEYVSEQAQPKHEIHADLSNVLQTRVSQLSGAYGSRYEGKKVFTEPVNTSGAESDHQPKTTCAIPSKKTSTSSKKSTTKTKSSKASANLKTKSSTLKTKSISTSKKKSTSSTLKPTISTSKPKADRTRSKAKSSTLLNVKNSEPLKDRTTKKAKTSVSSSSKERILKSKPPTISKKVTPKSGKKGSQKDEIKAIGTESLESLQSQSKQKNERTLQMNSSETATKDALRNIEKDFKEEKVREDNPDSETLQSNQSATSKEASLPSRSASVASQVARISSNPLVSSENQSSATSKSVEQPSVVPSPESTPASQQLHNLSLAFKSVPPNLSRQTNEKLLTSTKSKASYDLHNSRHYNLDGEPVAESRVMRPPMESRVSRLPLDFDNEDVFDQEMLLLEAGSDPSILEPVVGGSAMQGEKQKKLPGWKKVKRKQFTEDAESYLRPYMEAAVFGDNIESAQSMMFAFEKLNSAAHVEDYNALIQAWGRKGKWDEVRHLLARMVSKNVQSDRQTYAASLECLARCEEPNLNVVQKGLEQMKKDGILLEDVLSYGSFSGEGRQLVIELVQRLRPNFQPPGPMVRARCTTNLVADIYQEMPSAGKNETSSIFELMSREELKRKIQQQWAMELAETVTVTSVEETGEPDPPTAQRRKLLDQHRAQWRISLKRALENEKTRQHFKFKNPNFASIIYYPFLVLLQPEEYVELMIQALSNLASTTEGSMTVVLARDLSTKLHRKYSIRAKLKHGNAQQIEELYKSYVLRSVDSQDTDLQLLPRDSFQELEDNLLGSSSLAQGYHTKPWPAGMLIGIGTLLADIMLREIKIDANMHNNKQEKQWIPALYHMYTYRSFKHVGFIKPHPTLVDLFQTAKDPNLQFDTNMLPMLTPPIPWTTVRFGAYPLSSTKVMRSKDGAQQHQELLEQTPAHELHPILDALNQLSNVPWIINNPILDTVISVFRNNGSKELDVAQPSSACPNPPRITSAFSREELAQIHRERAAARKLQAEMHSLRMDMLYKLSIADKVRNEIFWFPHNMDFRGRVYPCPPHFNHFGNDVTRSLLLFARGKALGEEGFKWLKIHLVNLTGLKKRCSIEDRLEFAHDMMPEIMDSADRPLDGNKWWQKADEQWQTLAACIEVTKAIRSGDPASYVSHLPIHQDGSCNGLQHYAALGRDLIGAQQVNLHPFDVPQDVYSGVAQMVEEARKQDAEKGNKIAQALEGLIKRNVVKQTVMTVVYGVTTYGGRRQILKQLREEDDLSTDQKWFAAGYITLKVFQSIRKMFTKTREIQDYLTESAWLISKAGETVKWVTPLGLPVIQPYHKKSLKLITHGGRNVYHEERHSQAECPDTRKQKNAFPPNFIHSLDSTHMMLTSLYCQRAGITFASVHDCYWTHASTVNQMNKICRNQFVKLHKEPILDNLADFLVEKYGHLDVQDASKLKRGSRNMKVLEDYIKNVPQKGDFDLDNVLKSTFFFS